MMTIPSQVTPQGADPLGVRYPCGTPEEIACSARQIARDIGSSDPAHLLTAAAQTEPYNPALAQAYRLAYELPRMVRDLKAGALPYNEAMEMLNEESHPKHHGFCLALAEYCGTGPKLNEYWLRLVAELHARSPQAPLADAMRKENFRACDTDGYLSFLHNHLPPETALARGIGSVLSTLSKELQDVVPGLLQIKDVPLPDSMDVSCFSPVLEKMAKRGAERGNIEVSRTVFVRRNDASVYLNETTFGDGQKVEINIRPPARFASDSSIRPVLGLHNHPAGSGNFHFSPQDLKVMLSGTPLIGLAMTVGDSTLYLFRTAETPCLFGPRAVLEQVLKRSPTQADFEALVQRHLSGNVSFVNVTEMYVEAAQKFHLGLYVQPRGWHTAYKVNGVK